MSEQGTGGAGGGVNGGAAEGAGAPGAPGGAVAGAAAAGGVAPAARPGIAPVRPGVAGLSQAALTERLARERQAGQKAAWAELGITDPEAARKGLARLAELEAKNEAATRAQMTELEQLRADLETERTGRQALQAQLDGVTQERTYEKQDQLITGIAARHVSPKAVRLARVEFGAYVKTLTPNEQEKLTDRDAQKWFAAYAKENPEFALTAEGAEAAKVAAAAAAKKPAQRVITNGLPARRVTPPGGAPSRSGSAAPAIERGELPDGKTYRPGSKQADKAAVKEGFRKLGITYAG